MKNVKKIKLKITFDSNKLMLKNALYYVDFIGNKNQGLIKLKRNEKES